MSMAMELTAAMRNACHNQSDMIIHTAELTAIEPGSGKLFEQLLQATGLSLDHVYCTGEKGYQILGNRSHVLVCTTRGRCLCERCMGAALPHQ
ncbi:MAG: hypothetical protein CSA33_02305 [Desulfobulbus propionicus]|nr:MAG: hypothetical protein CSA33_02305 [Desulfobulbus propionicus]